MKSNAEEKEKLMEKIELEILKRALKRAKKRDVKKTHTWSLYDGTLIGLVVFGILIIASIIVTLIVNKKIVGEDYLSVISAIFAIIIAMIIPKHLVKNECQEHFHVEFQESMDNRYATKEEYLRVDAHLSRMNAFYLSKDCPIWSIGWAFRTLKRYQRLPESNIQIYSDFISSIDNLIEICYDTIKVKANKNRPYDGNAINDIIHQSMEGDGIRALIRAMKDNIDYIIYVNITGNSPIKNLHRVLNLLTLLFALYTGNLISQKGDLCDEICRISDYAKKEAEVARTQFFRDSIQDYINRFNKILENNEERNELINSILFDEKYKIVFDPVMSETVRKEYCNVELV
jgi:hypothetical protein